MTEERHDPEMIDFSRSPLSIPERFHHVVYNAASFPGAPGVEGFAAGANCQHFAYELLRHLGFAPADLRSSELWEDRVHSLPVQGELQPGDLLLFNRTANAWGAHVAVYLGDNLAIHLARHVGVPVIWRLNDFSLRPEYLHFLGARRVHRMQKSGNGT